MENTVTEKEAIQITIDLFKEQQAQNEKMKLILMELHSDLLISEYTSIGEGSRMHHRIISALGITE